MAGSSSRGAALLRALQGAGSRPRPGDGTRHLSSCGILAMPQPPKRPPAAPAWGLQPPARTFLNLAAPRLGGKRMEYGEARVLGYSMEQMYNVVANVESYQHFVPWCKSSKILSCRKGLTRAELEVGFAPLMERYVSEISLTPQQQIRAVCNDSRIFSHLETLWRFSPGLPGQLDTCTLDFYVSFEFKSILHSHLANLFFDEVVKQMVMAFERWAEKMYGPQADVHSQKCLQAAHCMR
ncbi:coenzyme Q-binding protein COQ10 homolog B, mitochondrial-like [Chelonoidis abingdonii]|uniref:Coenzyme Q-binding protein COQ10 START domain-containing protein n=1 Tax=Chelonoidis abingdonii TaxID=106734 RepID=A0A8C0FZS8_CHEAB|nr:coenzyme Q-binding protein COQ10 homolog B, mitochondrial-like isoform X1 [Chelonoidis abingdonii]